MLLWCKGSCTCVLRAEFDLSFEIKLQYFCCTKFYYCFLFEKLMDMGNYHLLMGSQCVLFQLNQSIQM